MFLESGAFTPHTSRYRPGHGASARVSDSVGVRESGRADLGQDEPAAETHQNGEDRPLAEPREGTLSGGRQGKPSCE